MADMYTGFRPWEMIQGGANQISQTGQQMYGGWEQYKAKQEGDAPASAPMQEAQNARHNMLLGRGNPQQGKNPVLQQLEDDVAAGKRTAEEAFAIALQLQLHPDQQSNLQPPQGQAPAQAPSAPQAPVGAQQPGPLQGFNPNPRVSDMNAGGGLQGPGTISPQGVGPASGPIQGAGPQAGVGSNGPAAHPAHDYINTLHRAAMELHGGQRLGQNTTDFGTAPGGQPQPYGFTPSDMDTQRPEVPGGMQSRPPPSGDMQQVDPDVMPAQMGMRKPLVQRQAAPVAPPPQAEPSGVPPATIEPRTQMDTTRTPENVVPMVQAPPTKPPYLWKNKEIGQYTQNFGPMLNEKMKTDAMLAATQQRTATTERVADKKIAANDAAIDKKAVYREKYQMLKERGVDERLAVKLATDIANAGARLNVSQQQHAADLAFKYWKLKDDHQKWLEGDGLKWNIEMKKSGDRAAKAAMQKEADDMAQKLFLQLTKLNSDPQSNLYSAMVPEYNAQRKASLETGANAMELLRSKFSEVYAAGLRKQAEEVQTAPEQNSSEDPTP